MPDRSAAIAERVADLGLRETSLVARDLLAAVGELMLTWGYLETAMIEALGRSARGPIVSRWLEAAGPKWPMAEVVRDAAAVRNHLAHGLCAVEARPPPGTEARVMCRDPDGGLVSLPISRLREVTQRLDALRLQIEEAARRG
jgi:hypothetical protein